MRTAEACQRNTKYTTLKSMISFLLAFPALFAAQSLDSDMTVQEKKKTGYYKLTQKEKKALQEWVDSHYEKRAAPLVGTAEETHATLSENLQSGSYLRLSDGSLWEIRPQDKPLAQGWITPVEIDIAASGDSTYPFKLTNSVTGSSLLAKKVSQVPKNPSE